MIITKAMKKYLIEAGKEKDCYLIKMSLGLFDLENIDSALAELNELWFKFINNKSNPLNKYFDGWIREIKIKFDQYLYEPYFQITAIPGDNYTESDIQKIKDKLKITWFHLNCLTDFIPGLDVNIEKCDFMKYMANIDKYKNNIWLNDLKETYAHKKKILFYGCFKGVRNIKTKRK